MQKILNGKFECVPTQEAHVKRKNSCRAKDVRTDCFASVLPVLYASPVSVHSTYLFNIFSPVSRPFVHYFCKKSHMHMVAIDGYVDVRK